MKNEERKSRWYFGGLASVSALIFTQPLDMIKVHLQTQQFPKRSIAETAAIIYKDGGILTFYSGISAGLARQLTYVMTRFGLYELGKNYVDLNNALQVTVLTVGTGTIAALIGIPTEKVNVRLQNDLKIAPDKRYNYKHVFDGLHRILKEEGVASLYRGGSASVFRSITITFGQNYAYDKVKQKLLMDYKFQDNVPTHILSSIIAGTVSTLISTPADVIKTRLMNSKEGEHRGFLATAIDISKTGVSGFWRGAIPASFRMIPSTIWIFVVMEQLRINFGYLPDE